MNQQDSLDNPVNKEESLLIKNNESKVLMEDKSMGFEFEVKKKIC